MLLRVDRMPGAMLTAAASLLAPVVSNLHLLCNRPRAGQNIGNSNGDAHASTFARFTEGQARRMFACFEPGYWLRRMYHYIFPNMIVS